LVLRANPGDVVDDEDIYVVWRRPEFPDSSIYDDDEELSDYVKFRLLVARILAMQKYREIWGT
jgi:hypothetical protein